MIFFVHMYFSYICSSCGLRCAKCPGALLIESFINWVDRMSCGVRMSSGLKKFYTKNRFQRLLGFICKLRQVVDDSLHCRTPCILKISSRGLNLWVTDNKELISSFFINMKAFWRCILVDPIASPLETPFPSGHKQQPKQKPFDLKLYCKFKLKLSAFKNRLLMFYDFIIFLLP